MLTRIYNEAKLTRKKEDRKREVCHDYKLQLDWCKGSTFRPLEQVDRFWCTADAADIKHAAGSSSGRRCLCCECCPRAPRGEGEIVRGLSGTRLLGRKSHLLIIWAFLISSLASSFPLSLPCFSSLSLPFSSVRHFVLHSFPSPPWLVWIHVLTKDR